MYLEHFELKENPFKLTPDVNFLYLGVEHARAKAYMSYTVAHWDGFVVITGQTGTGKTTLINQLVGKLDNDTQLAMIHHTQMNDIEFLTFLLAKLGVEAFGKSKAQLLTLLDERIVSQGRRGKKILLVIDEAHNLAPDVLEEIRLLSATEVAGERILNIVLVGHSSMLKVLRSSRMEQLSQRVRLWVDLSGFDKEETRNYIHYRLMVAGANKRSIFSKSAASVIYYFTRGIPRLINILSDTAMVAAYVRGSHVVTNEHVKTAIEELRWEKFSARHLLNRLKSVRLIGRKKIESKLIVREHDQVVGELGLAPDGVLIGSEKGCDLRLKEDSVGQRHALISRINGEYLLEDLDTQAGTFVNTDRVSRRVLKNNDVIIIGNYQIRFQRRQFVEAGNNQGVDSSRLGNSSLASSSQRMG